MLNLGIKTRGPCDKQDDLFFVVWREASFQKAHVLKIGSSVGGTIERL